MNLDDLERALDHQFSDRNHLIEALTHATWLKEQHDRGRSLTQRDQQRPGAAWPERVPKTPPRLPPGRRQLEA